MSRDKSKFGMRMPHIVAKRKKNLPVEDNLFAAIEPGCT